MLKDMKYIEEDEDKIIWGFAKKPSEKCLHKQCEECKGTGTKENGQPCIHNISCPCKRCNMFTH
jgi:hypothetical protein